MKSELKENMYIRTNEGIRKILNEFEEGYELDKCLHYRYPEGHDLYKEDLEDDEVEIVKASYSIIDILEKGDYVNGDKIEYIDDCEGAMREFYYDYENPNDDVGHWQEEIKTIITHEQMEQMAYKVGE